jgi:hypothetical protein
MCEPEVLEMLEKVGGCLVSNAYEIKAGTRDVGDLENWADSAGEHKTGEQKSKECSDFSLA